MQPAEPSDGRNDGADQGPAGGEGERSELEPYLGDDPETVIAEISPGIAVVFGPRPLNLELVDFGFVTSSDLAQL